jgi:hypothetical protein
MDETAMECLGGIFFWYAREVPDVYSSQYERVISGSVGTQLRVCVERSGECASH